MVKHELAAGFFGFSFGYEDGYGWSDQVHTDEPLQDGIELMETILGRCKHFENEHDSGPVINNDVVRMTVWVTEFVNSEVTQYSLFESNVRSDTVRKTIYSIKNKFGFEKIQRAAEITATPVFKDVIGFGSIKDITG
jgi:DNA polymerase-4